MKKILLATDFSKAAIQAQNYAIEIARNTGAEITVLNTFFVPAIEFTQKMPIYTTLYKEEKLKVNQALKEVIHLISNIKDNNGNPLRVKTIAEMSDPVFSIDTLIKEEHFELALIGNSGIDDPYRWYHSTASELIKETTIPILVVPSSKPYISFKHILYATELRNEDHSAILELINFAQIFNSRISVLHISTSHHEEESKKFNSLKNRVSKADNYAKMEWNFVKKDDVEYAIRDFIKEDHVDLLTLLKHPRNIVENLFHNSVTKAFITYSPVPLLFINEK
jgi:nucleotide-binding universal stress UspA family protein